VEELKSQWNFNRQKKELRKAKSDKFDESVMSQTGRRYKGLTRLELECGQKRCGLGEIGTEEVWLRGDWHRRGVA